ncbi:BMP family lipoprotein [Leucobacter luti]|uniref:Basic membrane protein A n=1 Tax=Leucobacter luti TaxID=340320 RepID=A0A4Q7U3X6_9MICO|nr:BMP family ABC transporter substrate-binding protein [Leucobacter luti]RZT66872.1 basic membrane protein A [Leucobacter luti]
MTPNHSLHRTRPLAALALTAAAALALAGCSGQAPSAGGGDADALNIGIFVDNAFGDGDFFDQASLAEDTLVESFGATVNTYEGQLEAQNFAPLLQDAADRNDIVYVLGFEAIDAMVDAAEANPDTQFVFIDGEAGSPEITSAVFRTQEGCFMAGALAATVNAAAGASTAGFIGGVNAPVVENCESGYTQGVAQVAADQSVASQYVGSFVDPGKGAEIATTLASTRGAYAMFAYAGLSGSGVFDAAKAGAQVAPIGVVADKSALAPGSVPGSLIMRVDSVIVDLTEQYVDGTLERGAVLDFGFAEDGWAMAYDEALVDSEGISALEELQEAIVAGDVQINE